MAATELSASERLLNAAREQLRIGPWATVTMAAVADGAGVSRQTLYNTFGTREQLGQAFLLREVESFLSAVEQDLAGAQGDADHALEVAFATFLQGARDNPLVRAIVVDEDPDLLALVITQQIDVVGFAALRLAAAISQRWPQAAAADVAVLADNLVRLAISYAAFPAAAARDVPGEVRSLLGPFVRAAVGG